MRGALFLIVLAVLAATLSGEPARAANESAENLNIEAELARPGVKLVVVEFFATWCESCMAAVPRWKALHEKYAAKGLRFIVVSAEDDKTCSRPPDWSPDVVRCDKSGALQERMGVVKLPTSFLYSWDGALSIKTYDPAPVEQAIERYFANVHLSMVVDTVEVIGDKFAIGSNEEWVRQEAIAAVKASSKFDVVEASYGPLERRKSDGCAARPTLPVNSVLRITLRGDAQGNRSVTLRIEKDGCAVAVSPGRPYAGEGLNEDQYSLRAAVRLAVQDLVGQVVKVRPAKEFEKDGWLYVTSEPAGAMVYINGEPQSPTPYNGKWPVGHYTVEARLDARYLPAREQVVITGDKVKLDLRLTPDFGDLTVTSTPAGASIYLNGEPSGQRTPYTFKGKKSGRYTVLLRKDLYADFTREVGLGEGLATKVDAKLVAEWGDLSVESVPTDAEILLNDEPSGERTLHVFKGMPKGEYTVTVRKEHYLDATKKVRLGGGRSENVTLNLPANYATLEVRSEPTGARIYLNGEDTGKTAPATFSPMKVGAWEVEARKAGYAKAVQAVSLSRGETKTVTLKPTPKWGTIEVSAMLCDQETGSCAATEAQVYLDGEAAFVTPDRKKVLEGRYRVRVEAQDGETAWEDTVEVTENKIVSREAKIRKQLPEVARRRQEAERRGRAEAERRRREEARSAAEARSGALVGWGGTLIGFGSAAVLGGAIALGLAGTTLQDDADHAQTAAKAKDAGNKIHTAELAGWSLLGIGAPLLAAGIALVVVGKQIPDPSGAVSVGAATLRLTPAVTAAGPGGVVEVRW